MNRILVLAIIIFYSLTGLSQVGINNPNPDTTAILDLTSNKLGLLIPRMTSFERRAITDPANGLLVYDEDDALFYFYDGTFTGNPENWTGLTAFRFRDDQSNFDVGTGLYKRDIYTHESTRFIGIATRTPVNTVTVVGSMSIGDSITIAPSNGLFVKGDVEVETNVIADTVKSNVLEGYGTVPVGTIVMWSGSVAPDGWVLCDGNAILDIESPINGTNTPNLSGRFIVGIGSNGTTNYTYGNSGGEDLHTLTVAEMPEHLHNSGTLSNSTNGAHTHDVTFTQGNGIGSRNRLSEVDNDGSHTKTTTEDGDHTHTISGNTGNEGGDGAHENRPPYFALAYIMRIK